MKKYIPNIITLGNLTCGVLSIWASFQSSIFWLPSFFIFCGLLFDFFDGFTARLLKVDGELGKQLDSLADLITFGLAPGIIVFQVLSHLVFRYIIDTKNGIFLTKPTSLNDLIPERLVEYCFENFEGKNMLILLPLLALIIFVTLSALRLAKFNISTNQSDQFIGLPTPANAVFWASILPMYLAVQTRVISNEVYIVVAIIGVSFGAILMSLLLVVNLPLIALKFKTFGWKGNEVRFIFLGLCLVTILVALLISNVFVAVPIIILLYLIISIINNITKRKNEIQSKH